MEDLGGKVAVVTGAASGIGAALARACAQRDMRLVLADVEEPALELIAKELEAEGAEVVARTVDVSKPEDVEALAVDAYENFGAVHLLCNNAGVGHGGVVWEVPIEEWEWVLGVNLLGVVNGLRSFVPRMLSGGEAGHVVNTASMAGLTSSPGFGAYAASKHAVVAISEILHHDLSRVTDQIGVSVLCPGWVNTRIHEASRNRPAGLAPLPDELTPEQQMGRKIVEQIIRSGQDPAEVAEMVLDAVRDGSFYVITSPRWAELARLRMQDIIERRPPTLGAVPGLAELGLSGDS